MHSKECSALLTMVSKRERRKQRARRTSETRISHTSDRKSIPSQRLSEPISRTAACSAANAKRDVHQYEIFLPSAAEARRIRFLFPDKWKITRTATNQPEYSLLNFRKWISRALHVKWMNERKRKKYARLFVNLNLFRKFFVEICRLLPEYSPSNYLII